MSSQCESNNPQYAQGGYPTLKVRGGWKGDLECTCRNQNEEKNKK